MPVVDPSIPASSAWMARAIDPTKEIVITADLRALLADESFAPATRKAMRAVTDRSVRASNLNDAWERARGAEIVLLEGGTVLLVLAEVPDLDPTSLTGWDGTWQWKRAPESPPGTLEHAYVPEAGSLWALADHAWVIGQGVAAQHARAALAETRGHPIAHVDLERPLAMTIPASRMVAVVRRVRVRDLEPALDGIRMIRASATLGPKAAVSVELDYGDEPSAVRGETLFARVLHALASKDGEPLAFLSRGTLVREGARLRVGAPLPADLLEQLAHAEDGLF